MMNSTIHPCIPMFSSCLNVLFLLILPWAFLMSKIIVAVFSFLLKALKIFVVNFDIASIVLLNFLKSNCVSNQSLVCHSLKYFAKYIG